jgi:leucyl/phenylalanyl-tRNA--protein transferase
MDQGTGAQDDMLRDDQGLAWIFRDDDWIACADTLAVTEYPSEFTVSTFLDADAVEGACLAGFMPMSARFRVPPGFPYGEPGQSGGKSSRQDGETRIFYTPKLHIERCILDPAEARINATTRRTARRFKVSLNTAFAETLAACIATHGDGWLTPPLTKVFSGLHADQATRRVKFISVELWKDDKLVAGEIGYASGAVYASLTGFRSLSGAGTVQLAALAGILIDSGFTLWDLGMPMNYKIALGGRSLPRPEYLPLLRSAYDQVPVQPLGSAMEPAPVYLPLACTRTVSG